MNSLRSPCLILLAIVCCHWQAPLSIAQQDGADAKPMRFPLGGSPIAATRRQAIVATPFDRSLDARTIRKWMELSSQCTIAEFELFLGSLSPLETRLLSKVEQTPAPIVNRLHFEDLRRVLKNGGILSLNLDEEAQRGPLRHTTPAIENELYGAYDCVFASVGPPDGSARYGDVIIRLKDSVRENGWATPFSGMHFLSAIRHKPVRQMQDLLEQGKTLPVDEANPLSLGFDDRLHFSHYIVTESEWNNALAYQAVLVLRNLDDSEVGDIVRQRIESILGDEDPREFWTLFIPPHEEGLSAVAENERVPLGYLEAKFPDRLSIEDFTSIEVPTDRLAEVRGWPEAKPYLDLIRTKPSGVE